MSLALTQVQQNSTYPDAGYPEHLGPSGKFVESSARLSRLEITGYRIKYSTVVFRLLEHQIRRGRKYETQVHTVNNRLTAEFETANVAYFQRKVQLSGLLAVPIFQDKWSSTVHTYIAL